MHFKNISILDENFDFIPETNVITEEDKIIYIGKNPPEYNGETFDGRGKLLMSGLYNTHCHSAMTLLRGYGEGLPLFDWLHNKIFPFEAKLTPEDVYIGSILGYAESLRFGTVSVSDMYFYGAEMQRAAEECGIKANICVSISCFDEKAALRDLKVFDEMQSLSDGTRTKIDYCLHSEYTTTKRIVRELAAEAKHQNKALQLHLSETAGEHCECIERHGLTPAAYFENLGVFDNSTTAAHCVHITDEDVQILKNKNVSVSCNPISNLKLGSGICKIKALLENRVNVALGTDGTASNNNLNMFEELKLFGIMAGSPEGSNIYAPSEALKAATASGAKAQRREKCGMLKQGAKADLIVLDVAQPHMTPAYDMTANLVFSAQGSDVVLTMVDGEVLYKNGEFTRIDIEEIKEKAKKAQKRILSEL